MKQSPVSRSLAADYPIIDHEELIPSYARQKMELWAKDSDLVLKDISHL